MDKKNQKIDEKKKNETKKMLTELLVKKKEQKNVHESQKEYLENLSEMSDFGGDYFKKSKEQIFMTIKDHKKISPKLLSLLIGTAVGDALGATSEFEIPWEVKRYVKPNTTDSWPNKYVAKGRWGIGEYTDDTDMALCILNSYLKLGRFDPIDIQSYYIDWVLNLPKDVGFTTRAVVLKSQNDLLSGKFCNAARNYYVRQQNLAKEFKTTPNDSANGSLMRNGAIPIVTKSMNLHDSITVTVLQSISTHYGPSPVICCVIHTVLMKRGLNGLNKSSSYKDVCEIISKEWKEWKRNVKNEICVMWLKDVKVVFGRPQKIKMSKKF